MTRIEDLAAFCEVVEQKSFSHAAERLHLSQPAVSQKIKALEAEYGVELLHRDGFEIVPTESGQALYTIAKQIAALDQAVREQVRREHEWLSGPLYIGSSTGPGEYLMPILLSQFKVEHPGVDVALQVADSSTIIDAVLSQKVMLGFVGTTRRDRHLNFTPFLSDELILAVPAEHEWTAHDSISLADLRQAPLILQQPGSGATAMLYEALAQHDINSSALRVIAELGLQESTKNVVRAGFGVTIISRLGALEELARGDLVAVQVQDLTLERNIYAAYRRTTPMTHLTRSFLQFAQNHASDVINAML